MNSWRDRTSTIAAAALCALTLFLSFLPAFAEEQGTSGSAGQVQERGVQKLGLLPPYACGAEAGVCMCVGQANCEQMTRPTPCKRPKFCSGQPVAQQPPPLPPQQVPQSMARTTEGSLVICSCRSGP
jgi:hypothetical protein